MTSAEAMSRRAFVAFASAGATGTMASLLAPAIAQESSPGTADALKKRWQKFDARAPGGQICKLRIPVVNFWKDALRTTVYET